MRNVKYRALAKDGTWRYGEYPHFAPEMSNTRYALDVFWHHFSHLRRETLGQFTGLLDKQGKEIYEGDILRDCNGLDITWAVKWSDKKACFLGLDWLSKPNEVIGNVYENPELLVERMIQEVEARSRNMNGKLEVKSHLICDKCGKLFWHEDGFLTPQVCDECGKTK